MSKEKVFEPKIDEESKFELIWLHYFQQLKQKQPDILISFFNVLADFVRRYPHDANHLTVDTLHGILLEEI